MQDDTRSEEMSQEDIRVEMRRRFDAANDEAEKGHKISRDFHAAKSAREDQRRTRTDAPTAPQDADNRDDIGGNDG